MTAVGVAEQRITNENSDESLSGSVKGVAEDSQLLQEETKQPAFPGADGFGRYTKGGRGGDVYHVTNLNDSGPGSLRNGIATADGPQTIVFQVDGTIELESRLVIDKPYITIAGQTAPQGWITLSNYELIINADHIIVRYLRVRVGDRGNVSDRDAISIYPGTNIIIDHCSASWSIDETLSANNRDVDSLTVQWSIVAESLHNTFHSKNMAHGYGGIQGARRVSYHHNLFAHHMRRMPAVAHGYFIESDNWNSVIYNWGNLSSYSWSPTDARVNWVNNYYKAGPATQSGVRTHIFRFAKPGTYEDPDTGEDINAEALFYIHGNYFHGEPEITADNWDEGTDKRNGGISYASGTDSTNHKVNEPYDYPRFGDLQTAEEAYEDVLASAGASIQRDPVDERIVNDVRTGTAAKGNNGFIDSQEDVGGWPDILPIDPPADSDLDGMPDWWENEHGLDPDDEDDRNLDRTDDGYTNLEEYLNWLADPGDLYPDQHPGNKEVTVMYLPEPVNLISPAQSSSDVSLQPEFSWDPAEHATEYLFQLYKGNMGFNYLKLDTVVTESSFEYPAELEPGQYYNWRVRGINEIEAEGEWSRTGFFTTEQVTSIGRDNSSRPVVFQLDQNYPNPFNPVTVIRYGLPESAYVDLRVYDVMGREVATLVQEAQQIGYHNVRFDSSSLTSGMYYYRIKAVPAGETGEEIFMQTRKMLLVR